MGTSWAYPGSTSVRPQINTSAHTASEATRATCLGLIADCMVWSPSQLIPYQQRCAGPRLPVLAAETQFRLNFQTPQGLARFGHPSPLWRTRRGGVRLG